MSRRLDWLRRLSVTAAPEIALWVLLLALAAGVLAGGLGVRP